MDQLQRLNLWPRTKNKCLHNLIPAELTAIFYNYIGKRKDRVQAFKHFIYETIWNDRATAFKQWELTRSTITRKKKKRYHHYFNKPHWIQIILGPSPSRIPLIYYRPVRLRLHMTVISHA